jgi:MATE family multidrug resistance protein
LERVGFSSFSWKTSPEVYKKSLEYIHYRSYGVFFSYGGVALISLYSGIARPRIILATTLLLAGVNLVLNYALIFGKFGLPEMGIGGSGLASSIAEGVAFVFFVVYMIFDKANRPLHIFSIPKPDWPMTMQQLRIALPIVAQAAVGQGELGVFLWNGGEFGRTPAGHFKPRQNGVSLAFHPTLGLFYRREYLGFQSYRPKPTC